MAFSITGMRRAPDVGFTTATRQTPEGARDVAVAFVADGLREVEVRDASGTLRTLHWLEHSSHVHASSEADIVSRLAAV